MAITQQQRIVDLAYAGMPTVEIMEGLDVDLPTVQAALTNLALMPSATTGQWTVNGELAAGSIESEGGIGHFGTEPPGAAAAVVGALSTVADAPAKAVLTSIIAALVATGQATNGTT